MAVTRIVTFSILLFGIGIYPKQHLADLVYTYHADLSCGQERASLWFSIQTDLSSRKCDLKSYQLGPSREQYKSSQFNMFELPSKYIQ